MPNKSVHQLGFGNMVTLLNLCPIKTHAVGIAESAQGAG